MTGSAGDQGEGLIKPEGIGTRVSHTAEVPFSRQVGSITRLTQQRGHGGYPCWQGAGIGGGTLLVIRQFLRQGAETHGVGLLPRQQGSTGRRTGGQHLKIAETRTLPGQGIQMRRGNFTAKGTDIGITHIIDHDQQYVGPRCWRRCFPNVLLAGRTLIGGTTHRDQQQEKQPTRPLESTASSVTGTG